MMPIRPDPMTLREVLRSVRHVLRSGRNSLRSTGAMESLPEPAARLARTLLSDVDGLARGFDDAASRLAGRVRLSTASPSAPFGEFLQHRHGDASFAVVAYEAMKTALRHFQAEDAFVSEVAARGAFQRLQQGLKQELNPGPDQGPAAQRPLARAAAALALGLVEARVLRGGEAPAGAKLSTADLERLVIFALVLWLLADRSDEDWDAALLAACELAQALSGPILSAMADRDQDALARLFERYAANV